ncbi:MAG: HAMP domain-containing histidine kinase [Bacteroidales bacterium]|jgi:two-component sensor histidine kinase|nr:HAMP domain-containing histidine kinase [Bacteroidales bacterium]
MNIYQLRLRWNFLLLTGAVSIAVGSLLYTHSLIQELSEEEHRKMALWVDAYRNLVDAEDDDANLDFYMRVIENNTTIPVIWTDENLHIIDTRNLDTLKVKKAGYLDARLKAMQDKYPPIVVRFDGQIQYIHFDDSLILYKLVYYPYVQLGIIILFVLIAYFAFSASRKSEQNKVWVGLSKETAHQLGTPLSSLLAITELLKTQDIDQTLVNELEKDVARLNSVTDRFSKIGSTPTFPMTDVGQAIIQSLMYIRKRSPDKVSITFTPPSQPVMAPLSETLFSWVIENLCKNALDAMGGVGNIHIEVTCGKHIIVDVSDTGKGIPKSKHKSIFKPGYTTKSRGWGLGLSLSKRIIESYHHGRIFVLHSEPDKGTTFRIMFND